MNQLRQERHGAVLLVVIDRPPVNALDAELIEDLRVLFSTVGEREGIRAVVLTASGTRAFSAGKDLAAPPPRTLVTDRTDPGRRAREMLESIHHCPIPVIAAVNGPAIGAGMCVAAVCDCVIISRTAWIQAPEINVGLLGAFTHLESLVGARRARHLYLTGGRCSAQELYEFGGATAVCEPEDLLAEAMKLATELASKEPTAVRLAKEAMLRSEGMPLSTAYRLEQDYTFRLRALNAEDAST